MRSCKFTSCCARHPLRRVRLVRSSAGGLALGTIALLITNRRIKQVVWVGRYLWLPVDKRVFKIAFSGGGTKKRRSSLLQLCRATKLTCCIWRCVWLEWKRWFLRIWLEPNSCYQSAGGRFVQNICASLTLDVPRWPWLIDKLTVDGMCLSCSRSEAHKQWRLVIWLVASWDAGTDWFMGGGISLLLQRAAG